MYCVHRTRHFISCHCSGKMLNLLKYKPNVRCLKSVSVATQVDGQGIPDSLYSRPKFLKNLENIGDKHFSNEFSKNLAVISYPGFTHALLPVLRKRGMIKRTMFIIDTKEKQEMFQNDPMVTVHMRRNVFKYHISSFVSGFKRGIKLENEILDSVGNISGVTIFSEVHDLRFVPLLVYRIFNEAGFYVYPVNWFLLMPQSVYQNLLLLSRSSYKICFHALHNCAVEKLNLSGPQSMHPVLLHVTPNYRLLHQLKIDRKFFRIFVDQLGPKTSVILTFVESMVTDSSEVVRPLLDSQYTRVCDVHPTKLLEIFVALTNMPEFEGSMFKQILYKEQWDESRSEE